MNPGNMLRLIRNRAARLKVEKKHPYKLQTFGTKYGSWTVADLPDLKGSTVILAGAGEDISFDVALAHEFNTNIVVVDPTPRAIEHVAGVLSRVGKAAESDFIEGGNQPVEAYDLQGLRSGQMQLEPVGLWNEDTETPLFAPPDPSHVSYSAINFQNNYARDTEHIVVPMTTVDTLMKKHGIEALSLIKLDIEGAEVEVIADMLDKGIYPTQICLEFDELHNAKFHANMRVLRTDRRLRKAGYRLVYQDATKTNFLYIRDQ